MTTTETPFALVPLDQLRPSPKNANIGDVDQLVATMRTLGWWGTIEARPDGEIIAGEHRWKALTILSADDSYDNAGVRLPPRGHVWVDVLDTDDPTALAIAVADNRTRDRAVYDDERLIGALDELERTSVGLLEAAGWSADELDQLRAETDWAPDGEQPTRTPGALVAWSVTMAGAQRDEVVQLIAALRAKTPDQTAAQVLVAALRAAAGV